MEDRNVRATVTGRHAMSPISYWKAALLAKPGHHAGPAARIEEDDVMAFTIVNNNLLLWHDLTDEFAEPDISTISTVQRFKRL
ncbi:hypothetical protein [Kushneria aurantia]|uniref:Uncharacterized protein n=1 Tax=Kushneria aurantia TaxID=504092 RepID=A0ABV6G2A2_9GAMM|nr:hypothetical protein [Kushneria aurantia]